MKTGRGMDLDQLRELIRSIEHHELQINIDGEIFVYSPEEHGEKPDTPEEPIEKCPECGAPATHPSGLCRDCHQAKLEETPEDDEIAEEIDPELERPPEEAIVEEEKTVEALIPE